MAVSDRIRAEARRTIDGMQKFYEKYGDDIDDAEEREHRVARVEAALEGCNGLSQEDKIQKTAENLFELTCSQERTYDALRREMKITRDDNKAEFSKINSQMSLDFAAMRKELKEGLASVLKKIEDSGSDSSLPVSTEVNSQGCDLPRFDRSSFLSKIIADHPTLCFSAVVILFFLVFVSGHFDEIAKIWNGN